MLKKFLLNTLSSFVGTWIAIILIGVVMMVAIFGIVGKLALSSAQEMPSVKKGSILQLTLDGPINETETPAEPDLQALMAGNLERPQTLDVIVEALREGADNKNVSALYIECGNVAAAPATLDAIRHAVVKFKESGKKVYAYGDNLSMGAYYVASCADRIYLNPGGELSLNGISGEVLYMKELFDNLGINFQVVKVGTFKSAVEPYIMNGMSEPARAQLDTLYGYMWNHICKEISASRKGVSPALIDSLVNVRSISFADPSLAVKAGLVDSLIYGRQIRSRLADLCGREPDKLNIVAPQTLVSQTPWTDGYGSKNQIALLYACGEIADGSDTQINYETLVPLIVKLADDENVKGMVLRVNSPGGSAFGSEQIGEALDYFMSKGKTLSVSMGDYAASGGYWISAGANRIFADPLTITGSIGIFGMIPCASGLASKIGVHPQTVSTNPEANFPNIFHEMTPHQLGAMQAYVDRGYEKFVGRVAKGRHMKVARVKQIAEGRVWSAPSAVKIGLVDSLAYLQDAIEWTASKAGIPDKYEVAVYPEFKPTFWNMVASGTGTMRALAEYAMRPDASRMVEEYARKVVKRNKVQAKMIPVKVRL